MATSKNNWIIAVSRLSNWNNHSALTAWQKQKCAGDGCLAANGYGVNALDADPDGVQRREVGSVVAPEPVVSGWWVCMDRNQISRQNRPCQLELLPPQTLPPWKVR